LPAAANRIKPWFRLWSLVPSAEAELILPARIAYRTALRRQGSPLSRESGGTVTTSQKTIRAVAADAHSPLFRVVVTMLLAFSPRWAGAQTLPGSQQIIHEFWSFREGAPQVVESLAQTTDGYLWLGTESGLYRFDGVRFERFQSPFGDSLPATDI